MFQPKTCAESGQTDGASATFRSRDMQLMYGNEYIQPDEPGSHLMAVGTGRDNHNQLPGNECTCVHLLPIPGNTLNRMNSLCPSAVKDEMWTLYMSLKAGTEHLLCNCSSASQPGEAPAVTLPLWNTCRLG